MTETIIYNSSVNKQHYMDVAPSKNTIYNHLQ